METFVYKQRCQPAFEGCKIEQKKTIQMPSKRERTIVFARKSFQDHSNKMYGLQTPRFKIEDGGQGGEKKEEGQLVQGKEKLDC